MVGYAGLAVLSIVIFRFGNGAAGVWLANVFAVAMLLRMRSLDFAPALAAVVLACTAANLVLGADVARTVVYSLANAGLVGIEAALLQMLIRRRGAVVSNPPDYAAMLGLGGIAAPALVACAFAAVNALAFDRPFLRTVVEWVVGEGLGFAILLPVLMLATGREFAELAATPARLVRLAATVGASILLALAAVNFTQFPFLLVIVPPMVAATIMAPFELAIACGAIGAMLVGLVVAGVVSGLDPSNGGFPFGFQLSVAIVVAVPFACGLIVEQMRRDRRRIAESEQHFRRAMEDSAIGVAIVALDGHIVKSNRAFAEMLGYSREEMETRTFYQITHPDDVAGSMRHLLRMQTGEADNYRFEKRYVHKDGRAVWARLSGSVIRDAATGAPLHLVSQIEDIDARKRSEEAIAKAETRWSFALASAGQGMWDLDIKRGRVTYSSTWNRMLGYEDGELDGNPDHWLTLVHPEDRIRVEAADRDHFHGRSPLFEAEFRMRHKQGHWVWILDRGQIIERDDAGAPARAIGTLTDITVRREAEERLLSYAALLADEKERLRVTLDSIGDAVICTDAALRVTFMNPVAEKLVGVAEGEALGRPLDGIYAPVDEESGEPITTTRNAAELKQRAEHNSRAVLRHRDGSHSSIREVVSPILNDKGEFGGAVIVFQDFTDARALQRQLAHAAAHDSLTGLANRAFLRETMSAIVEMPRTGENQDLFVYIDLDNFKLVNDTGGHAAGDLLLKQVADVLRDIIREGDVAARVGGDEFAVILRNCRQDTGDALATRLVTAIAGLSCVYGEVSLSIGASVGVTAIGRDETDIDEVIVRADLASYRAKTNGGSQITVLPAPCEPVLAKAS